MFSGSGSVKTFYGTVKKIFFIMIHHHCYNQSSIQNSIANNEPPSHSNDGCSKFVRNSVEHFGALNAFERYIGTVISREGTIKLS